MEIKLYDLEIENFKGIKRFGLVADGGNVVITAENGVGKTSVYDAFLWLLFAKNSEGLSQFGVSPVDKNNKTIKGLVVSAEAILDIDGKKVTLKKDMVEKIVKKQVKGYTNHFWINDVPKLEKEYSAYIEKLIPEDTFKVLTDLTNFNRKLHWKDRRTILMDIAGDVEIDGFEKLIEIIGEDRTIDEYKTILAGRKKGYVEERDEINPRIDELQKGLNEYADDDPDGELMTEGRRNVLKADIAELDKQRKVLIHGENDRQENIGKMNILKAKLMTREAELKNDTTGVKKLIDEKADIEKKVGDLFQKVQDNESLWKLKNHEIKEVKAKLEQYSRSLVNIRLNCTKAMEAPVDDKCHACGQTLPKDKMAGADVNRKKEIAEYVKAGNENKAVIKECKESLEQFELELAEISEEHEKAQIKSKDAADYKATQLPILDDKIKSNPTIPPASDKAWNVLNDQIAAVEKEIGEPAADQLDEIETARTAKSTELEQLNKTLANTDNIQKNTDRIAELSEREKELAQKIADVEAEIAEIDQYKKTESELIEEAVNDKFAHTKFKLFDYRLNGEINPTCIATLDGVNHQDMSSGQEIYVGIDIINVLSEYYDMSVVLFIDKSEGYTLPIEAKTQTICLKAVKGVTELEVEIEA